MPYAYDPELAPWIDMLPQLSFADIEQAREMAAALASQIPPYAPSAPIDVRSVSLPGSGDAPDVPARIYTPTGRDGESPCLLYLHGGGFAFGTLDTFEPIATRIADEIGAVVVAVGYRLAPENPFPSGLDDCYTALLWAAHNAAELGIDVERVGVGGESAGAGLAAALALLSRDRGGPALCFQFLIIPELDDRLDTPSMRQFTDTPVWYRANAEFSWDYYLGGTGIRGGESVSMYAAPARAADLSGLPPAYVAVSDIDPLRDEGLSYAHRLIQAGVATELHHFPGTFHGSGAIADAEVSRRMAAEQLNALRRGLRARSKQPRA